MSIKQQVMWLLYYACCKLWFLSFQVRRMMDLTLIMYTLATPPTWL